MSYSIQINVVGDDGDVYTLVLDNFENQKEAVETAMGVGADWYERTGIQPQLLDTDEPDPFDASSTPWTEGAPRRGIYVFGSNEAGRHGGGSAFTAHQHYGAVMGQGWGLHGDSFAIPTKGHNIQTLPLDDIERYVEMFLEFARDHPELLFFVTKIGCGLAGYAEEDIAPMFKGAPENVGLPSGWTD